MYSVVAADNTIFKCHTVMDASRQLNEWWQRLQAEHEALFQPLVLLQSNNSDHRDSSSKNPDDGNVTTIVLAKVISCIFLICTVKEQLRITRWLYLLIHMLKMKT